MSAGVLSGCAVVRRSRLGLAAMALCAWPLIASEAFAQSSCETDIKAIIARRQAVAVSLQELNKGGKGKLDPVAACPKLKSLAGAQGELIAYMTKNKDWCNISDDAVANVTRERDKMAEYAGKACALAAQTKKMQEQQAAGGGAAPPQVRLPAGPL